jgi:[ribosomal protein S5]-alanine N-acetyltransferase
VPLVDPGPIETPRLLVRRVAETDLPALLAVNGDVEVTRYLPYPAWATLADGEAWLQRMNGIQASGTALQFVIVDRTAGQAIGTCLLFRHDEGSARAELGYVLARACWGRGLMKEALVAVVGAAFTRMGLRRLEAEVDPRNSASGRSLQSLGFTREGVLRQRWVAKGEAHDVEAYGLLRHEWPGAEQPAATPEAPR